MQVVADRAWVSFMRSYPNLIPLAGAEVTRIRDILAPLRFDRVYGAFWGAVVPDDAHAKVLRSADRYVRAVGAGQPPRVWTIDPTVIMNAPIASGTGRQPGRRRR